MNSDQICQQYYYGCIGISPSQPQKKAWELLSSGKSVVIRSPTGSGKTEAVVLPFLALGGGEKLPGRILYALPLRSLARQVERRIEEYAKKLGKPDSCFKVRLQHGKKPESVLFAADAVVATIDQVITSYACTPLTLPVRHGNIPAGAVMSSFLVFDEVHLFDPELGLQATRLICERLHRLGIPYALLSATLPDSVVEHWQNLGAEIVEAYSEFVERKVTVEWKGKWKEKKLEEEVGAALKYGRVLVICNTVDRAMELYNQVSNQGYQCNLLHSRFLPDDRASKEDWVLDHFGKNAQSSEKLLIATQVVEAGLDISADVLLTEVAPVDALIQRAGRVARWGGNGSVWVYDVEKEAPYRKDLVDKTRQLLVVNRSAVLDWTTAKCWVNQVLNDPYRRIFNESNAYEQVVAHLCRAAFEGSRSRAAAAVRDVNTVEVTIYDDPQTLQSDALRLPVVSVHLGIARKWAEDAMKQKARIWRVEIDRTSADGKVEVKVNAVSNNKDIRNIRIGDRLVFPPSVLTYCSDMGLRSGSGQSFSPLSSQSSPSPPSYSQQNPEPWIDHSVRVAQEMCKVLQQERCAVLALARLLNVSGNTVREAAFVAALLHDLGKLTEKWQNEAGISNRAQAANLLAHTPNRTYSNLPPHATVSAYALWETLVNNAKFPRILAKAVCFAIAHHHSVRAKEVPEYELHPVWKDAVKKALHNSGLNNILNLDAVIQSQKSSTSLRERFPPMEYEQLYTAYVLLSRWLRLADRIATGGPAAIEDYENWFGRL